MSIKIRIWFLLCFGILSLRTIFAVAQEQLPIGTQDKFVISELKVTDSGSYYFTVSLEGTEDRLYCAYNMTITLPVGLTFKTNSSGNMSISICNDTSVYPIDIDDFNNISYHHSVLGKIQTDTGDRVAKVICSSNDNSIFQNVSGALFNVFVNVSEWSKPGENEVLMTGLNLTTKENAQKYIPVGDQNTGYLNIPAEGRKININISADNKWATCILPFDYEIEDGIEAYQVSSIGGNEVLLNKTSTMTAYKPYLLYAENGITKELTGQATAIGFPEDGYSLDNRLCGVIVNTEVSEGYILQNKGDGAQFYRVGDTPYSVRAGKCYIEPLATGQMLSIKIETTSEIETEIGLSEDSPCYNLLGIPIQPSQGIYIQKGKKQIKTK